MRKRFLFTDLDLTLLTSEKTISAVDLEGINDFLDRGNCFAFVTGRPFEDTSPLAKRFRLEREGVYIASFNGGLISRWDDEGWTHIYREPVSYEDTRFLFEEAEKMHVHCQTYTEEYTVALHDTDILQRYTRGKALKPLVIPDLDDLMAFLPTPPLKVVCAALNNRPQLERFQEYIDPLIKDRLFSLFSSDRLLEFGTWNATKAKAVGFLSSYAGVLPEDTVAAGDEANDISMIEAAGIGYAVSNARDEVKEIADRITVNDHDHGAIAEIIRDAL